MRQKRILSGTVEQQLAQVDAMIVQMKRREVKHVIGIIPPIPIFSFSVSPGANGEIFKYLSPLSGKVVRIAAMVESMPKSGVNITINSESDIGSVSKFLTTKKKAGIYQSDMSIIAGDRITVTVKNENQTEEEPRGIWLSVLIQPLRTELESEKFLLSALEEKIDSQEEGEQVGDSSLPREE